jgi:hypothetical protein
LTADLRYVELRDVKAGDKLVSFDEHLGMSNKRGRRFKTGTVLNTRISSGELFDVTLSNGKVFRTTKDHKWLTRNCMGVTKWQETQSLTINGSKGYGTKVSRVMPEWETLNTRQAGWLAGMYDGEEFDQVYSIRCRTQGKGDNKRFIKGESYFRQCRGIAIANFVGMEIGRMSFQVDELAMESKDARNARRTTQHRMEIRDYLDTAEESGQFTELDMSVLRIVFNPDKFGISNPEIQNELNLAVHERSFRRLLKSVTTRFKGFCRQFAD